MSSTKEALFINEEMLSKLPGVGDEEVSVEEREMAKQVGRAFFSSLGTKPNGEYTHDADEICIPESVGRYRIFSHKMSPNQPLYRVDDSPEIERKLDCLYNGEDLEYSMVVASAASVGAGLNETAVADKPMTESERIVFFLCGGGFASSDTPLSKWYYLRLSKELGMRLFVSRYNAIPDHVFPRALHDVYSSYNHLLEHSGFKSKNIVFVANSAGCNLALGAMQLALMHGRPMPAGCVLVSPLLDLTMAQDSWRRNQDHCVLPLVPLAEGHCLSRVYFGPTAAAGTDAFVKQLRHPLLSPLFCDAAGFPPMQVQVGGDEVLLDEAKDFVRRANKSNVLAELVVYPQQNHYTLLRGRSQLDKVYGNTKRFIDSL
ncbi:hypothetical protein IW140_004309 [Coemansia sp. RSA 1813]|nr:hypothetical protein EV178_004382 [Coemansia sp. RSA 1646]KAJ1767399.1 hypothetical protein LPJ74_005391 [Coemansia sp. RSA 1843]KAJ2087961.1 hypothetical protein IW138_004558 [Coemansia sp. RSA 986]KAJ2211271.1 hypothetical protein EV179_005635 [Coemansia sp. RSA 487]KAJ2567799.1 hypothetical protein IW140_004309 [Coemansia sp. RSA 1813]